MAPLGMQGTCLLLHRLILMVHLASYCVRLLPHMAPVFLCMSPARRYHISDSAAMHRQAWHSMDRRTSGIRARFPFINTAVGYVSRWFLSLR
jgi:hypothetical protein